MQNIISNNCVGARIYQLKKDVYETPFTWCLITPSDFLYIYENFESIDFKNAKVGNDGRWYFMCVDGKVRIYYPHYRYDKNCKSPTKKGTDELNLYYCKIDDYITEKYKTRVLRMTGRPIFLIDDKLTDLVDGKCAFYEEDILKYTNKENCIITTSNKKIKGDNVIYKTSPDLPTGAIAKLILKEYKL